MCSKQEAGCGARQNAHALVPLEWLPDAGSPRLRRAYSEAPSLLSVDIGFDDLQVCADPGVPDNGFRTPGGGGFLESSVTQFHCQDGFTLKGPTKRLCVRHLNGTLGWIPSDKPFCAQEGKVPAPACGGRSRGRGARPHQPRGRDPGRTVPANLACWRERGGAAGAGGEGGSASQVTVFLLYRDCNLGRPILSGLESSSGHRRAARCCAASQPRAHGHGAGESAVNVPLKARGRRDACYSDQLGDRRVCSRRDSLRETERGGDRRWDICFPQLPYSFSLRRGIH